MSKKVLLALGIAVVVLVLVLAWLLRTFVGQVRQVNLVYWGLWEDQAVISDLINEFQRRHPNVKITFLRQGQINYRERVTNALQRPGGTDIVRIHSTWLPMFKNLVSSVPEDTLAQSEFQRIFYPAHFEDLILGGKILAIPLEIDGLVLFANEDLLNQAGVSPVENWEEFRDQVQRLTVRDDRGRITTAGAALGAVSNVDHWQDILSLMFYQNGADIQDPRGGVAAGALNFYTDFVTKIVVWDETLESSTEAFARGKVAYYFGPTWRYFNIKELSQDSGLRFRIVPVPQLQGEKVNVASYWAEAVSAKSPNQKEAFEFLKFLVAKENLVKLYTAQTKQREFGEPYSRLDLKDTLTADPNLGPFIQDAQTAKSSYLASFTWDGSTGINSRVSKYYEDAVNSVLRGGDAASALETVDQGMQQVLGDYGLTSSASGL